MKPIPLNDETKALAESLVWFEPPAEALAIRFASWPMPSPARPMSR
jgi:hypothetical protein